MKLLKTKPGSQSAWLKKFEPRVVKRVLIKKDNDNNYNDNIYIFYSQPIGDCLF